MENAVEAIKMAFAVMVFVMALSVSMFAFNKAKATSDVVLYTQDETNYYEYQGISGKAAENRIVGIETIIPTLYKYYKENYTVIFRQGSYNADTGELSNLSYLPVYETGSVYQSGGSYLWGKKAGDNKYYSTYDELMENKYNVGFFNNGYPSTTVDSYKGNKKIFSFDLEEETLRREPWTGDRNKIKKFINDFLDGEPYANPNDATRVYKYLSKTGAQDSDGFVKKYANKKFVETVGEYSYNSSQADSTEDGSLINGLVKEKKKRVIIFTLIN